jgi:TetR/AcrR family transcriptional repressor of nem operon
MPRIPEYNRAEVVNAAMLVFWERGYNQTSVTDLVVATGLQPGSLYAAFGNKKGVFLEVLEVYHQQFLGRIRELGQSELSVVDGIRRMLRDIAEDASSARGARGCLAVNALLEMANHEPEVARLLERHNGNIRRAFAAIIESAQQAGDIANDKPAAAAAAFLVNNIWGMRVMCKGCADREAMDAIVDGVIAGLVAH